MVHEVDEVMWLGGQSGGVDAGGREGQDPLPQLHKEVHVNAWQYAFRNDVRSDEGFCKSDTSQSPSLLGSSPLHFSPSLSSLPPLSQNPLSPSIPPSTLLLPPALCLP